ncbi:MAG: hypothetical protein HKN12_04680, partial [Gemmatimonadetes bacterium]|nr:hypothetical protein [Gemmatimonadota bacterium]
MPLIPALAAADIAGEPSGLQALTGVTIVAEPGATPVTGTVILRDGAIEMLGSGVEIPPGTVVHERPGRVVYAGFIEPYLRLESPPEEKPEPGDIPEREGVSHDNHRVHADRRVADGLPLDEKLRDEMRDAGYAAAFVAAGDGVFRGVGAVVGLGDGDAAAQVIDAESAQVVAFETGHWTNPLYPNSLMGAISLTRQTLYDADWHRQAWDAWEGGADDAPRPLENAALRALEPALQRAQPVFLESEDLRMMPRVLKVAREFRLKPVVVSGGADEWRRPERVRDWLKGAGADLVLAVDFPRAPHWNEPEEQVGVELDRLIHWERAPTSPRRLQEAGVRFAVTTQGLEERAYVLNRLRTA